MKTFLWHYLCLPVFHWLLITLAIGFLGKFFEAKKLVKQSKDCAMLLHTNAKMAEIRFQVTRADGTKESPQTYRTYRNPLRRWLWAVQSVLTTKEI
jgi:hypothetical protein